MQKIRTISLCLLLVFSTSFVMLDASENVEGKEVVLTSLFSGLGSGTIGDPYQITNVSQLQEMDLDLSANYSIMNDIDASETANWNWNVDHFEGFEPTGDVGNRFKGSLDGQFYNITGLFINRTSTNYVGLLSYLDSGASLSNISMIDNNVSGKHGVGGFAGGTVGTVTNCSATGDVSGSDYIGGLVGVMSQTLITNCYATGNVFGTNEVGGLVGRHVLGTITNCFATGIVHGTNDKVGGLVGYNYDSTVTNCYATGNVHGTNIHVGGLVGYNVNNAWVTICYATGNVNGTTGYVGGLVGCNEGSYVRNCYATGNVSGPVNIGGLVGYNNGGAVLNCYSIGNVSGSVNIGGLVGWNTGSVLDCFWDTETSGLDTSEGGTGKTTAEMMQQDTFDPPWNFTNIWGIIECYTYPYFQPLDLNIRISVKLPLSEGWNLLSIPVTQSSENLGDILKSIDGKWDCIQIYDCLDPKPWKTNATFRPDQLNDFNVLNHKMGFWINITEPNVTLTLYGGLHTSTSIPLYAGWNLVGYPTLNRTTTVGSALFGTADKVEIFDSAAPYRIKEVDGFYLMKPGEGYWVHVPVDTVWVVDW